jgi:hypothetical protein
MNKDEVKEEEFNPNAFLETDTVAVDTPEDDVEVTDEDKEESTDDSTAEAEDEKQEGGSSTEDDESKEDAEEASADSDWDIVGETEAEVEDKTETEDDTKVESNDNEAWRTIADDLGMEVNSVDELKQRLLHQKELAKKGLTNEKVDTWKGLKSLEDEALVRKELEAKKYSEEEIEDEIDVMIENRTLKGKARDIRNDLDAAIENEIQALSEQPELDDSMSDEEVEEARRELKDYLSKTEEFFGGRVNEKQKDEHYNYIQSGKYFDEVTETAESIAKAAWLWRYRDQITKAFTSKGREIGKKELLDNLQNPEVHKSNNIPEPQDGFSSAKFLDTEQM